MDDVLKEIDMLANAVKQDAGSVNAEIEKEYLRELEGYKKLEEILMKEHPELYEQVYKVISKKAGVDLPLPEEVVERKRQKEIERELRELKKAKEEEEKKRLEEERQKQLEQYNAIMDMYGIPREKVNEVAEYAKRNGIFNWETACKFYAMENRSVLRREISPAKALKSMLGYEENMDMSLDSVKEWANKIWKPIF